MTAVMKGVRILEVAEQTFVPAASALLADLGADVIKIEHVTRGDAMRGLASTGVAMISGDVHILLEHCNRGKKSIGLDLATEEGVALLYQLAATCDVFLTNKLPGVRSKLKIGVEDIRKHNPNIIYVRGTGQGERGPEADRGSYDALAFWNRSGVAMGVMKPGDETVPNPPGPGFGDSIGAMTIAGGISAALFHRERTGEATVVDVSLLSSGMWAQGQAIGLSAQLGIGWGAGFGQTGIRNPIVGNYKTKDDRWVALICLQAMRYWPEFCGLVGVPELAEDPRFGTNEDLLKNGNEAVEILKGVFAERPVDEWRDVLAPFSGQWTVVQDTLECINDVQTVANGYMQPVTTAGGTEFKLVASPIQFDEAPAQPTRAPAFNEHADEILTELGLEMDAILDLKLKGVVA